MSELIGVIGSAASPAELTGFSSPSSGYLTHPPRTPPPAPPWSTHPGAPRGDFESEKRTILKRNGSYPCSAPI